MRSDDLSNNLMDFGKLKNHMQPIHELIVQRFQKRDIIYRLILHHATITNLKTRNVIRTSKKN